MRTRPWWSCILTFWNVTTLAMLLAMGERVKAGPILAANWLDAAGNQLSGDRNAVTSDLSVDRQSLINLGQSPDFVAPGDFGASDFHNAAGSFRLIDLASAANWLDAAGNQLSGDRNAVTSDLAVGRSFLDMRKHCLLAVSRNSSR